MGIMVCLYCCGMINNISVMLDVFNLNIYMRQTVTIKVTNDLSAKVAQIRLQIYIFFPEISGMIEVEFHVECDLDSKTSLNNFDNCPCHMINMCSIPCLIKNIKTS